MIRSLGKLVSTRTAALLALLVLASSLPAAAAAPAPDDERLTVIRVRRAIPVSGPELERAVIVLSGGKIQSIGSGLKYPLNARVIDLGEFTAMPGLIDAHSRFGLENYNRAEIHANWTAADEWLPRPDEYEELLQTGYTALALYPGGAGIPGRAFVIRTGGPAEQRVLQSPSYLRIAADKKTFREALEKARQEIEKVDKARADFEKKQQEEQATKKAEAEKAGTQPADKPATQPADKPATPPATQPAPTEPAATQPAFQPPPIDPSLQALVDLLQKKPDLFALLEMTTASEFLHLREVLEKHEIAHHFFARNGFESDLFHVADKLGELKVRIVLLPLIGRVPASVERLHLVKLMSDAGCEVSLVPPADTLREHGRIRGRLAELVREGWSRELALKAVTLHPARLLGLDARLGTLEKDKEADLIFLDGDPLDPTTRVRAVMIGGELVWRGDEP